MVCGEDYFNKDYLHIMEAQQYVKGGDSQPIVLTNLFPSQQQQMVAQTPAPLSGGTVGHSQQGGMSSATNSMIVNSIVALSMRAKNYDTLEREPSSKDRPPNLEALLH